MLKAIYILSALILCASCAAQSVDLPNNKWEVLTTGVLRNPKLLSKNWVQIKHVFAGCEPVPNEFRLDCGEISGIKQIILEQGPAATVSIEYASPAGCAALIELAKNSLGNPSKVWSACQMDWNLRGIEKGLHARIANSKKSPGRIFLIMSYEQGP